MFTQCINIDNIRHTHIRHPKYKGTAKMSYNGNLNFKQKKYYIYLNPHFYMK